MGSGRVLQLSCSDRQRECRTRVVQLARVINRNLRMPVAGLAVLPGSAQYVDAKPAFSVESVEHEDAHPREFSGDTTGFEKTKRCGSRAHPRSIDHPDG